MKKTLLIAAAALAAGVISTQAQPVYSQNVVGYVNITCAPNQFTLLGNQLDTGSNTLNNVLQSGLVSNGGDGGSTVSFWTGTGFQTLQYYSAADAAPAPGGWYDAQGNYSTNNLPLSVAVFLRNGSSTNITVTLVGDVATGTNNYTVVNGLNFYSTPLPLGGTSLDNTNVNFPATSGLDTYQIWTGTSYGPQYTYYSAADAAPSPGGWYNADGTVNESTNAAAWPPVGQGYLVNHSGGTMTWTTTFAP